MEKTFEQIINACCGKTENNKNKCAISLTSEMWKVDNYEEYKNFRRLTQVNTGDAELMIRDVGDFTEIKIIYANYYAMELRSMWNCMEKYGENVNNVTDDSLEAPIISLTAVPVELNGKYYFTAINPIYWMLTKENARIYNCINLLFRKCDIQIFATDEINFDEIDKENEKRVKDEEMHNEEMERRYKEKEDYMEERNRKVEELRKNKIF